MPARITWLGHSTVLVELDGIRVLTDPVVRSRVGPLVRVAAPVRAEGLRDVDAVLLSHMHADHDYLKSLRKGGKAGAVIAPRGVGAWLRRRGLSDVRELGGEHAVVLGIHAVRAIRALHD